MKEAKMLIGDINSTNINDYLLLDGFVMPLFYFASIGNHYFTLDEIKEVREKTNKIIIVKIDKVMEEKDLSALYDTLEFLGSINIDYLMFSDFAVLSIGRSLGLKCGFIYSNSKMLASFEEVSTYTKMGLTIMPSSELTLEEIKSLPLDCCSIFAFGYIDMFYSRRELLSLFEKHQKKIFKNKLRNRVLFVKEEKREDLNLIYENHNGTFIFSSFVYSLLKELPNLKPKFFYLSSLFIEDDIYRMVISLFNKAKENEDMQEVEKLLITLINNIDTGFLKVDSQILLKEQEHE